MDKSISDKMTDETLKTFFEVCRSPEKLTQTVEEARDKWPVVIVAAAMTHARTRPIGENASYITNILEAKIAQAIDEDRKELVKKVEEIIQKERFSGAPYALNQVIALLREEK